MGTPETGTTEFTTPTDLQVVATRVFDAPRERVWQAWTDPNDVAAWMTGPDSDNMTVQELDLRPGGRWHFSWRLADGSDMAMTGEYREVVPPERFVQTENWGGDWPETVQTLELIEQPGGKTLTIATVDYPSKEARDAALAIGMTDGWSASYDRLDD